MSLRTLRIGLAGLLAVVALSGGLLLSGALVSAQTPEPAPSATEQAGSTPKSEEATPGGADEKSHRGSHDGLCDKDGDGQPDGTHSGARGERHRMMVQ